MRLLLSFGLALALGTAATAPQAAPEARLSERVSLAHGSFDIGGGMTVASELRRTATGGTALCGVWAESADLAAATVGEARRILGNASVYVNGRRIAQDLRFMPQIAPQLDYAGTEARCRTVDLPWREGLVPEVFLPRRVIQPGTRDTLGNRIGFRQTGTGATSGSLDVLPLLRRQIGTVPLSSAATVAEGRYSSGGGLRVAAEIVSRNGQAVLCGVWSDLPRQAAQTEPLGRMVLREAEVTLGNRRLDVDPGAFRRVPARRGAAGATANCLPTGLDWSAEMARARLSLALPSLVVYRSTTLRGSQVVRFSPGR